MLGDVVEEGRHLESRDLRVWCYELWSLVSD